MYHARIKTLKQLILTVCIAVGLVLSLGGCPQQDRRESPKSFDPEIDGIAVNTQSSLDYQQAQKVIQEGYKMPGQEAASEEEPAELSAEAEQPEAAPVLEEPAEVVETEIPPGESMEVDLSSESDIPDPNSTL